VFPFRALFRCIKLVTVFHGCVGLISFSVFAFYAGHSIRTSLIPEAVLWYTGEAIEDDDEEDDDENIFEDADEDDEEVRLSVQ